MSLHTNPSNYPPFASPEPINFSALGQSKAPSPAAATQQTFNAHVPSGTKSFSFKVTVHLPPSMPPPHNITVVAKASFTSHS